MSEAYWTWQCEIQHSKVVCCNSALKLPIFVVLQAVSSSHHLRNWSCWTCRTRCHVGEATSDQPHKHPAEPLSHRQHTVPSPRASRPCGRRGFFALPSSHILHVQLVRSRLPTFCVRGRGSSPSRPCRRPRGIPGKTGVEPAVGSSGPRGNLQRRCVRDELRE